MRTAVLTGYRFICRWRWAARLLAVFAGIRAPPESSQDQKQTDAQAAASQDTDRTRSAEAPAAR